MTGPKWTPAVVLLISLWKVVVCLPPTFDPINTIQIPEDTAAGSAIGVLTVRDTTPSHITLTLSPTTQQNVYLNQHISINGFYNASIVLQRKLDYETDGSSLRLVFTATNPSTPDGVRQDVTVIITDVNDNPPQFLGLPYSVSVPENHIVNTVILTANSTDPDTGIGGLVNYTMKTSSADVRSKFQVTRTGNVTLIGALDYETISFYQFTIVATDGGGLTSEAQLFVTVTDVQDTPPYFTGRPYLPDIWEDHAVNSNVVTISAQDGDRGNPNNITYRITGGTCPGYFNIDPTKGTIDLIHDAERDIGTVLQNNGICVIDVQAVEVTSPSTSGATASDTVTVTIKDKNDNSPRFSCSYYEATIQENMPTGIPITFTTQTIHVEDKDQGDNAKLSLTLDYYSTRYFEIVPSTVQGSANLQIRVKDNTILDYEQRQSISLTAWANETSTPERNTASTTIRLYITNQNDNSPNFTKSDYIASAQEGSGVSTSVITVTAEDHDLPPFRNVTYALRDADGMFSINSSGVVTVASDQLDRETKSVYYIFVEATDPGGWKDTALLTVNITDANDNPPVFRRDYDGYLKENEHSFSRPISVSATDADVGVNGLVRYSISRTFPRGLDSHFAVDGVIGVLSVVTPIVNSSSTHVAVSVRASDSGTPPLYSDVNVTISLLTPGNTCRETAYPSRTPILHCEEEASSGSLFRWCSRCEQGFYRKDAACEVCPRPHAGCRDVLCSSPNNVRCTSCHPGFYLTGSTCLECPQSGPDCQQFECTDPHQVTCTKCNEGFFFFKNQCTACPSTILIPDCVDVVRDGCFKHWCRKCAPGFFISGTACDVCPVPDVGCQVAECNSSSSDSHCVRCFHGYQLQGGSCHHVSGVGSTPTSQCVDRLPKADCASLQSSLNVCSEPTTACNYCPQYCKMCDTCPHSMPVVG
ncbi:cadherin-related family member 1-like isoform X1 [Haliotis rufescens]|uniref:cadherin-related family member 1-like isoform X1 n=1 Tax=Haliotis rufescens TaxID=6454 RepID=UPI00201EE9EE|nr:cadherin-related family member 1-like isoform X1 [Haliotis rufescens]